MNLSRYFHENPPDESSQLFEDTPLLKTQLWKHFAASELKGINQDDCSVLPRLLPRSYLPAIHTTALEITEFALQLLSLPENEIRAIIPTGPIRDFLMDELKVLKYRPKRLVGSFRFDMAITGPPTPENPPKLLEINEIGFGGLSRSTFIQNSLISLRPQLQNQILALDTADAEIKNMKKLGNKGCRFQYDSYDWEEEVLIHEAGAHGLSLNLISPAPLDYQIKRKCPQLEKHSVRLKKGRILIGNDFYPDFLQMGYSFELEDYLYAPQMYAQIVKSETPQYSPFITGLVASKMILVLLNDPWLRKKFQRPKEKNKRTPSCFENAILPARTLLESKAEVLQNPHQYVIKHIDGLGGEKVFFGKDLVRTVKKIKTKELTHWVAQEKIRLNTLLVHGILSRPRRVLSDLGVFVQYDWAHQRLRQFEVGGFITRATNHSYKVNVSHGGIQVPVFFI